MGTLIAVNVGQPREVAWQGKTIRTAIWKQPVATRVFVGRMNIAGDAQADLKGHGGEQRAVLVYQLSSYRYWNEQLGRAGYEHGQFGENLTVEGLEDAEVCIGDRYRIGSAVFEVTQPRVTCFRLGIRMSHPELPGLLVSHGRPGFYMRVVEEGEIGAGDDIVKVADGPGGMSVTAIDKLLYTDRHPDDELRKALSIPALSAGWRHSFEALLEAGGDAGGNTGLGPVDAPLSWPGFREVRVGRMERESDDVLSFWLESTDGTPLPDSLPGQHIAIRGDLGLPQSVVTRMYSLSGPQGTGKYRISVKREELGIFSQFLHARASVGMTLDMTAPRGSFHLAAGEHPVVLLSAGIGVTPMLAMLHALRGRHEPDRKIWWFHGARDGRHHAFRREVEALLAAMQSASARVVYSRPGPDDRIGDGFHATGRLSVADLQHANVPKRAEFYLCGPARFLEDIRQELLGWGVEDGHIHSEVFGPEAVSSRVISGNHRKPHMPVGDAGRGPLVHFVRSGLTVNWCDRYRSLLELAEACDVPAAWSCRTGVCHTCQASLMDGKIRYAMAEPLSAPSPGTVLICCAQPDSDIELEL